MQSLDFQPSRTPTWLPGALLTLLIFLVFLPTLSSEFVAWDDYDNVSHNPDMNPPTVSAVAHYWTGPYRNMYIPLSYTVWSAIAAVARTRDGDTWSLNPWIFHAANLALHMACALLVYAILKRLLPKDREKWRDLGAFAGAILFAIHPMQVEPVAWVTGLRDVLSGTLTLAATWCYITAAQGRRNRLFLGAATFAFAILAKPAVMTLPLALAAIDYLLLKRPAKKVATAAGGWLILSIAAAILTKLTQPAGEVEGIALWLRPLVALDAITFYISQLLFPASLGIDYGRSPQWLASHPSLYINWLPAATLLAFAWFNRKRLPQLACAAAIFVAFLLPVLGLTKFDFQRHSTVADRYVYLAMLGPALLLAWIVTTKPTKPTLTMVAGLLLIFAIRAHVQTRTWHDSESLYANAVKVNPTSLAGNNGLGQLAFDKQDYPAAVAYFETAVKAHPEDAISNYNLGNGLVFAGRSSAAIQPYRISLRKRHDPFIYTNLAAALARSGRVAEALQTCHDGLAIYPENPELHQILGVLQSATTKPAG